ncbi:MAG: hypothetical protein ACQES5_00785 [Thermodesulfobacteriota bacterium]
MEPIQYLYDSENNFLGVILSSDLWERAKFDLQPHIAAINAGNEDKADQSSVLQNEPIDDWDRFLQFWDFRYPQENGVICNACGNSTDDWVADEPRKFYLKAANIGGLVAFHCCACGARVLKRHFKDGVHFDYQDRDSD